MKRTKDSTRFQRTAYLAGFMLLAATAIMLSARATATPIYNPQYAQFFDPGPGGGGGIVAPTSGDPYFQDPTPPPSDPYFANPTPTPRTPYRATPTPRDDDDDDRKHPTATPAQTYKECFLVNAPGGCDYDDSQDSTTWTFVEPTPIPNWEVFIRTDQLIYPTIPPSQYPTIDPPYSWSVWLELPAPVGVRPNFDSGVEIGPTYTPTQGPTPTPFTLHLPLVRYPENRSQDTIYLPIIWSPVPTPTSSANPYPSPTTGQGLQNLLPWFGGIRGTATPTNTPIPTAPPSTSGSGSGSTRGNHQSAPTIYHVCTVSGTVKWANGTAAVNQQVHFMEWTGDRHETSFYATSREEGLLFDPLGASDIRYPVPSSPSGESGFLIRVVNPSNGTSYYPLSQVSIKYNGTLIPNQVVTCGGAAGQTTQINLEITIPNTRTSTPHPTNTPTARPTNSPTPRPTNTSAPRPTNTHRPNPTPTTNKTVSRTGPSLLTARENSEAPTTPRPTNTASPRPTNTASPRPTNTTSPRPTNTSSPRPTNTITPSPTATARTGLAALLNLEQSTPTPTQIPPRQVLVEYNQSSFSVFDFFTRWF